MSTKKRKNKRSPSGVPRRAEILDYLARHDQPVTDSSLYKHFSIRKGATRDEIDGRLRRMQGAGQVIVDRRGRIALPARMGMVRGRVTGHRDGYGFLTPDQGGGDIYLPPRQMRKVLHGDRVVGRVVRVDRRGRQEGSVVEVLEHGNESVVGRLLEENGIAFLVPDDSRISQDILVPPEERGRAQPGQIVVAKIVRPPSPRMQPVGRVVEVLGEHMAPGMEIEIALRKHGLPFDWSAAVETELEAIDLDIGRRLLRQRKDLRKLPLVTIDGEDARDFDDAVYCEKNGREWRLLVAIADVSHYVAPGTALDEEAYRRGNSVYFPRQVIPMLPELLSNELCSLKPDVDRLCMVCDMQIGSRGSIKHYSFYPGVMRSRARLTYTGVAAALSDTKSSIEPELSPILADLHRLSQLLRQARFRHGSIDLDLPETRIIFNPERKIERIEPVQRTDAHRLIEECMLAANICAADMMLVAEVPGVFRVHEPPALSKLEDVRRFLGEFGLSLGGGDKPTAKDYSAVVDACDGMPFAHVLQVALLRSLSQAVYAAENNGHFALGFELYAHFTSPIRRYPDLLVHRTIKQVLARQQVEYDEVDYLDLQQTAEHCSMTERRADDATRDVERWLKAEYMLERVGETYSGVVSSVTDFGLFVELDQLYVEGLVHITALGSDYYEFDTVKRRLTGRRSGVVYQAGERVEVRVVRVNLDEAKIDFELLTAEPRRPRRKRRRKR